MECRLVKLDNLSGEEASIYSIYLNEEDETLFGMFLKENISSSKNEINDLVRRLYIIGNDTGSRDYFFKENEGNLGDGVCALYDDPDKKLRLYCVRFGTGLLVLGGGGEKPKNIRKLQEDPKLKKENYFLREFVKVLREKQDAGEIKINYDNYDKDTFKGDLDFEIN